MADNGECTFVIKYMSSHYYGLSLAQGVIDCDIQQVKTLVGKICTALYEACTSLLLVLQ